MDRVLLLNHYREHIQQLAQAYGHALAAAGYDALVIHAGSPQLRTAFDDQYWPLRVTPHFQHWLPLMAAGSALVISAGKKPKLVWLQEPNFWESPEVGTQDDDFWQDSFEISKVDARDIVRTLLPTGRVAFIGEDRACATAWGFDESDVLPARLLTSLDALRTHKTAYEELCLAEANRRAAVGHAALAQAFRTGNASELDLHLLFLRATGQDDPETPYKNIVALGENAATLHHVSYRRSAPAAHAADSSAQSLLVDAGATCYGYCSDITRTYVKGSDATASAFAGLVSAVERLQQRLCSEVRLGMKYERLHDRAHEYIAAALCAAGIVKLSEAEAVSTGITRAFLPHGLGHSLGLQCHDVGCATVKPRADNPFLRNTSTIEARQCFTIEPGLYFIPGLLAPLQQGPHASGIDWRLVSELGRLGGIRIEDDLVVMQEPNTTSTRNLTREHLPT